MIRKSTNSTLAIANFDDRRFFPSVERLPAALTINGLTVYPAFRYKGGDATSTIWKPWGYGEVLTLQAGTAPTYNNGSPLLGDKDDSIKGNAGGWYKAANTTAGNVLNGYDMVLESVAYLVTTGTVMLASKRQVTTYQGWGLYMATTLVCVVTQAIGSTANIISAAFNEGWYHIMVFVDRSGSGQIYLNGVASGNPVDVTAAVDMTGTGNLEMLSQQGGTLPYPSNISYISQWVSNAWLDTHLQAAVAKNRYHQLLGIYPSMPNGVTTATFTRALAAYSEKTEANGSKKLYYVGSSQPRIVSRIDANGKKVRGLLIEPAATNAQTYSRTFSSWPTEGGGPTITPNADSGPAGDLGASLIAGLTDTVDIYNYGGTFAANTPYVPSFWIKRVSTSGVLAIHNANAIVNGSMKVDMAALPDEWVRLYPTSQYITLVNAFVTPGTSDRSGLWFTRFSGAAPLSFYLDMVQTELGNYPTSFISTTTAAVARPADVLSYTVGSSCIPGYEGTMTCKILGPSDYTPAASKYVLDLATNSTNRISLYIAATTGQLGLEMARTGGTSAGADYSPSVLDNKEHKIMISWRNRSVDLWLDGVLKSTTTADPPKSPSTLYVGQYNSGASQLGPIIISNVKLYPSYYSYFKGA